MTGKSSLLDLTIKAESGDAFSQNLLGSIYATDNSAEAAHWYRKAADQGNAMAQCSLGMMYALGNEVQRDYEKAYIWLSLGTPLLTGEAQQKVELENGQFRVSGSFQMYRLEDRLLFLCHRFSKKKPLDRTAAYWGNFKQALDLRNSLAHPKTPPPKITEQSVERALQAILQLLDVVYQRIYSKKYPARKVGLDSNVEV